MPEERAARESERDVGGPERDGGAEKGWGHALPLRAAVRKNDESVS